VIVTDRLELVRLDDALELLAEGRRGEAAEQLRVTIPSGWPDAQALGFLAMRARQVAADPEDRDWISWLVVLREPARPMIGYAGFHGKPGKNALNDEAAVEVGYQIFSEYRRRGYATETVRALLDWALEAKGIRRFVASIGPRNEASLALARRLGFVEVGRHWDDEDGDELEFVLEI
jgi:ribosomal-protein-alanine N-acetyltransferase